MTLFYKIIAYRINTGFSTLKTAIAETPLMTCCVLGAIRHCLLLPSFTKRQQADSTRHDGSCKGGCLVNKLHELFMVQFMTVAEPKGSWWKHSL
jgi:hypothetical protein